MNEADKKRPIRLMQILKERTDENHPLSTYDLIEILKSEGIDTHRITLRKDYELLNKCGINVKAERKGPMYYRYLWEDFDDAELKALIDAVQSAKFIPKKQADSLTLKLATLAGPYKSQDLIQDQLADERIKGDNEFIFKIVDVINQAISNNKKISFQKIDHDLNKETVLHNQGEIYTFSPYCLACDGDYYYVIGYSDKYQKVLSHRVDRINYVFGSSPKLLDQDIVPAPEDLNINEYVNTMFRMFDAPRKEVELLCETSTINGIIDRFGKNVHIEEYDDNHFKVTSIVAICNVFFGWIFGFEGKVKIISPMEIKQQYEQMVKNAFNTI